MKNIIWFYQSANLYFIIFWKTWECQISFFLIILFKTLKNTVPLLNHIYFLKHTLITLFYFFFKCNKFSTFSRSIWCSENYKNSFSTISLTQKPSSFLTFLLAYITWSWWLPTPAGSLIDRVSVLVNVERAAADMPLADQRDVLEQLRELEIRHPGRALELHQKLSSPSRRRTLAESLRSFHTKQAKAQEKRAQLMQDKWHKLQELNKKVSLAQLSWHFLLHKAMRVFLLRFSLAQKVIKIK